MQFSIVGFKRSQVQSGTSFRYGRSEQDRYELMLAVAQQVPEVVVISDSQSLEVLFAWETPEQMDAAIYAVRKWGRVAAVDYDVLFHHHSGMVAWEAVRRMINPADSSHENSVASAIADGFELASQCHCLGTTLSQVLAYMRDHISYAEAV